MDYFNANKAAWEEAFDRRGDWCRDMSARLRNEELPYLNPMLRDALRALDLKGKVIAQLCCNNGRELLSAMQLGARKGVGFDIAENMIAHARQVAGETGIPCEFHARNILDISHAYDGAFDLVLFTIGAITWFEDLHALFAVASRCLKKGGVLLLNDFHPVVNMLPLPGEKEFDPESLGRLAFSYFRADPWLEQSSGGYMGGSAGTRTFMSFSHTMGGIVNAAVSAGLRIASLMEFDRDVGTADVYDGKGYPLSFTLQAVKD